MAIHTELEVHKVASSLFRVAIKLIRNMPRDIKPVTGRRLHDEALEVMTLIGRANMSREKAGHLQHALECIWTIEVIIRALVDEGFVSRGQHAETMRLTASVSRQLNAWRKSQPRPPQGG